MFPLLSSLALSLPALALSLPALALSAVLGALGSVQSYSGHTALDSLRSRAPESTVLWIESSALEPILEQGLTHPLIARILREPLVAADLKRKGFDPAAGLRAVEALVGQDPFQLVHALASGGVALGFLDVTPGQEAPFLMFRGLDGDEMEAALDDLEALLLGLGVISAVPATESGDLGRSIRKAWRFHESGAVAVWTREGTLILANRWQIAVTCCQVADRSEAIPRAYRDLQEDSGAETFAWLDLDALENQVGLDDLRAMAMEPAVHFVLGPALTYLGQASSLAMDLDVSNAMLCLSVLGEGIDAGAGAGSFPTGAAPLAPHAPPHNVVATGTLHRDVHFLLANRVDLFPPRTQPDIAEGLANLALLVGGPDALDELLASLRPTMYLDSQTIDFPANAEPDVPLPSLLLRVNIDDPEVNGGRLTSAFQTAVTLANVERAMNGNESLRLGLESVAGITVTRARLQPPPHGSSVDLSYNLEPACALVGGTFLVGTHGQSVTGAVQRLQARPAPASSAPQAEGASSSWVRVDRVLVQAAPLHGILQRQRDLLVMNAVLEEGKSQARAEAEADFLLKLLSHAQRFEFRSDWRPAPDPKSPVRTIRAGLTIHLLP